LLLRDPWKNNDAEHAIKAFAKLRRKSGMWIISELPVIGLTGKCGRAIEIRQLPTLQRQVA
jgi:hypothetical protein